MSKNGKDVLLDVHQRKAKFEAAVERLNASKIISRKDKELILSYLEKGKARNGEFSVGRKEKLVRVLRIARETLGKDFERATSKDMEELMEKVKARPVIMLMKRSDGEGKVFFEERVTGRRIKPCTLRDYAVILNGFYKWVTGDESPEVTRKIRISQEQPRQITQDEIITWDDVLKMSGVCQSPRDRALVQALWESGIRISEMLTLLVGDVEVVNDGQAVILHLRQSKTKIRNPVMGFAGPAMLDWLECHPYKDDPKAPLWIDFQYKRAWCYDAARRTLKKLGELAGLEKPVNPHSFRKSSASFWSHHLTDSELENRFGWVQGSRQKRAYCFPDEDKINNRVLQVAGIEDVPKTKNDIVEEKRPYTCLWCETINPAGRKTCTKCRRSLNPTVPPAKTLQEEEKKALISEIMQALEAKFGKQIAQLAVG